MEDFVRHFGIDWRLLLAQAANFGVLLFILWKFAYRPILGMLKERREGIERGLALTRDAERRMAQIEQLRARRLEDADRAALAVVSRAEDTAKQQRAIIVAEAAKKGDAMVADARRAIAEEKAKLREALKRETQELIRDGITEVLLKMPPAPRDRELIDAAMHAMKTTRG